MDFFPENYQINYVQRNNTLRLIKHTCNFRREREGGGGGGGEQETCLYMTWLVAKFLPFY